MIHLTNNCYQVKHKDYKAKKEESIGKWGLIEEEIGKLNAEKLKHQMKRVLMMTYAAAHRKLMDKKGTY